MEALTDFVTAGDVLRIKADLRDRLRDPVFRKALAGQYEFINEHSIGGQTIGDTMGAVLDSSRTYRIEHQMTDAIMKRATQYRDDEAVFEPPTRWGFVVLEKPIAIQEVRGRWELIHVITWGPVEFTFDPLSKASFARVGKPDLGSSVNGVFLTTWNDTVRQGDEVYQEAIKQYTAAQLMKSNHSGRWSCTTIRPVVTGNSEQKKYQVGPQHIDITAEKIQELHKDGVYDFCEKTVNMNRVISALFELLSNPAPIPATTHTSETLNRTERKQAVRNGVEPEVVLVTLNPTYKLPDPERRGTGTPIGVKYFVGAEGDDVAYYRTIHKGTVRERKVPVRPHWRGKPDAPESARKTVYNLGA